MTTTTTTTTKTPLIFFFLLSNLDLIHAFGVVPSESSSSSSTRSSISPPVDHWRQQPLSPSNQKKNSIIQRRDVLKSIASGGILSGVGGGATSSLFFLGVPTSADAATTTTTTEPTTPDLTTQLFNDDGSLKQDIQAQAKFRQITVKSDASSSSSYTTITIVDGKQQQPEQPPRSGIEEVDMMTQPSLPPLRASYQVPEQWSYPAPPYVNTNTQEEVCRKISVLRIPDPDPKTTLMKATKIGVAKALQLPTFLQTADLVGGRTVRKNTNDHNNNKLYYEFDLAVAPTDCDKTNIQNDNLGLGLFCPYDTIVLVSATASSDNSALNVILVEAGPDQWKRANADLRRLRTSFTVQQ